MIDVVVLDHVIDVDILNEITDVDTEGYAVVESGEEYHGCCDFVPSKEKQIVPIANKMVRENIVIEPIPSNYGLITYDGFGITVS